MAEKVIVNKSDLVEMADVVRDATGSTESLTLSELKAEFIGSYTGEVALPELANPAVASDLRKGKQLISSNKEIVTGTMPDVEAATPTISVSASGLITSETVQKEGYVVGETKSVTKQLPTVSDKTITPTKSTQTAVESGKYTTGAISVAAIPDEYHDVSDVTATAAGTLSGQKFVDSFGTVVTGTMPNNGAISSTMDGLNVKSVTIPEGYTSGGVVSVDDTVDNIADNQADLIEQIQTALASKTTVSPTLQSKTVTPTTSSQIVSPDSGYDGLSDVTVYAIPNTYVEPSATKGATTYTPTTSDQTIATGTYLTGVQTIKGDANLVAANIAEGISIFGVVGTHSGGSDEGGTQDPDDPTTGGDSTTSINADVTLKTKKNPMATTTYVSKVICATGLSTGGLQTYTVTSFEYMAVLASAIGSFIYIKIINNPNSCTVTGDLEILELDLASHVVVRVAADGEIDSKVVGRAITFN